MANSLSSLIRPKDVLVLAALLLISVAVRIPGANHRAIWYDEAITLLETAGNAIPKWSEQPTPAESQKKLMVGTPSFSEIAQGLRRTDVHPPFYYDLLSMWRRTAGWSIESARAFSIFWSVAAVLFLFLLLRLSGFAHPFAPSLVYSLSSGAVHYGHEARNYSLAMCLILMASFFGYISVSSDRYEGRRFWISSFSMAAIFCMSILTNYLAIFPVFFLLLWFIFWMPRERKRTSIAIVGIFAIGIALMINGILSTQVGSRPHQFQKALGFVQEINKIFDFNYRILWSPVVSNPGVETSVLIAVLALVIFSIVGFGSIWRNLDRRLITLMIGLAVAPSLGLLALDLAFGKDLGKSSYVLFGGPAVVVLLTLTAGLQSRDRAATLGAGAAFSAPAFWLALPFFVGLQLTGINFDLERTPAFAGSTLRSLAGTIESTSPEGLVAIGAGHGRGDPASLIYELASETDVLVFDHSSDMRRVAADAESYADVWIVFARGRRTNVPEKELLQLLTGDGRYRVVARAKRFVHLRMVPSASIGGEAP